MVRMDKTAYINARMEKKLKADAEKVFREVGVSPSDALTMFYRQAVIQQGIPFEVCTRSHVPNAAARKALREARDPAKRAKLKSYATTEEMFADILGKNWRKRA